MIFGDLSIFDELEFKTWSRQLDLLSRGTYSPIADELAKEFPNSKLPVRAIPFVERYVAELSGHYAFPAVRKFGTDAATAGYLSGVYETSQVDAALGKAEDHLWTQNVAIIVPMPDGMGRVRLQTLLPWQIDSIDVADPMRADDPSTWTRLVAQVPISSVAGQVVLGRMELTRETATRTIGASVVGIFNQDGSHGFGRVPVAVAYRVSPDVGRALPPVNQAVLNLQIALSLQQADNEGIVRNCAFPQKWIRNARPAQLIEALIHGPDKFLAMIADGPPGTPAPELAIAQGVVPVAELVSFAEHEIRLYCSMLGLDPSTFLRVNTSVTAEARLFSAQDRQAQRSKIETVLQKLEADVLRMVCELLALQAPDGLALATATVSTSWYSASPSPNRQSDAQAATSEVALGITSPADPVMAREGCSREDALAMVKRNLKESRELGLIPPERQPATQDKTEDDQQGNADEVQA